MAQARRNSSRGSRRSAGGKKSLAERTPIAEWTAAAIGLTLTAAVVGYSLWEGVSGEGGAPALVLEAGEPAAAGGGFVMPVTLRNESETTAASVWIVGVLERDGRPVETRRAVFDYAPGKGEVRGGLVFQNDPAAHVLRLAVEGFQEP